MIQALLYIRFLECVVVLLLLTNGFTLALAAAAMWLRDCERLKARLARRTP